jgi:hypothetical protein
MNIQSIYCKIPNAIIQMTSKFQFQNTKIMSVQYYKSFFISARERGRISEIIFIAAS